MNLYEIIGILVIIFILYLLIRTRLRLGKKLENSMKEKMSNVTRINLKKI